MQIERIHMYKATITTLQEILIEKIPLKGWLYLETKPWDLNTEGIMVEEDKDADPSAPFPPKIIQQLNLIEVLDAAGIEDIIDNAESQISNLTAEQILLAFEFYFDNDAFIEFDENPE
jgi:hypothetical protein